jgi:hypothetical protein
MRLKTEATLARQYVREKMQAIEKLKTVSYVRNNSAGLIVHDVADNEVFLPNPEKHPIAEKQKDFLINLLLMKLDIRGLWVGVNADFFDAADVITERYRVESSHNPEEIQHFKNVEEHAAAALNAASEMSEAALKYIKIWSSLDEMTADDLEGVEDEQP